MYSFISFIFAQGMFEFVEGGSKVKLFGWIEFEYKAEESLHGAWKSVSEGQLVVV